MRWAKIPLRRRNRCLCLSAGSSQRTMSAYPQTAPMIPKNSLRFAVSPCLVESPASARTQIVPPIKTNSGSHLSQAVRAKRYTCLASSNVIAPAACNSTCLGGLLAPTLSMSVDDLEGKDICGFEALLLCDVSLDQIANGVPVRVIGKECAGNNKERRRWAQID